jgi:hypothetical protein
MTDFPNEGQTFCVFLLMTDKVVQFFGIFHKKKITFSSNKYNAIFCGKFESIYAQLRIEKNSFEILKLCYLK